MTQKTASPRSASAIPAPARRIEEILRRAEHVRIASPRLVPVALGCLVAGSIAAAAGLLLAPAATWGALLANWLFWTGLGQGGVVLAAALELTESRWGRLVQRMAAGMGAFLPVSLLLLPGLWFERGQLFPTLSTGEAAGMLLRDWLALAAASGLSLAFLYALLPPELRRAPEQPPEKKDAERRPVRMRRLAAAVVLGFFPTFALIAGDLEMRVEPGFHSTILPGIYLAGAFYSAVGVTALLAASWQRHSAAAREVISGCELLDLGNLVWAFALFLGYVWWAQHFTFWMGNLPHEAEYHIQRWRTLPWSLLAWTAVACAVAVPGLLLFSRALKRHPRALALAGGLGALGVLVQRFLDILPSVHPEGGLIPLLVALGVSAGFLGAAALPYAWLMRRVRLFPLEDPLFVEELQVREVTV